MSEKASNNHQKQSLVPAVLKTVYGAFSWGAGHAAGVPLLKADGFHDGVADGGLVGLYYAIHAIREKFSGAVGKAIEEKILPPINYAVHAIILGIYGKISFESFHNVLHYARTENFKEEVSILQNAIMAAVAGIGVLVNTQALKYSNAPALEEEFHADRMLSGVTAGSAAMAAVTGAIATTNPEVVPYANGAQAMALTLIGAVTAERCRGLLGELITEGPGKIARFVGQKVKKKPPLKKFGTMLHASGILAHRIGEKIESFSPTSMLQAVKKIKLKRILPAIALSGVAYAAGAYNPLNIASNEHDNGVSTDVPSQSSTQTENSLNPMVTTPSRDAHSAQVATLKGNNAKSIWQLAKNISPTNTECVSQIIQNENKHLNPKKLQPDTLIIIPSADKFKKCNISYNANSITASAGYTTVSMKKNQWNTMKTQFPNATNEQIACLTNELLKNNKMDPKHATKLPEGKTLIMHVESTCINKDTKGKSKENSSTVASTIEHHASNIKSKMQGWWNSAKNSVTSFLPNPSSSPTPSAFEQRLAGFTMPNTTVTIPSMQHNFS